MTRYLVTGGAGFIGSHIVERLVALGEQVRVLDNFSTGKKENLAAFLDRIELVAGDLRDDETLADVLRNVDYVLHNAAIPSVARSVEDPVSTLSVNVIGTAKLLRYAREAGVRRLVFASSSSVYGDTPRLPKRETMMSRPLSPYAVSKLSGEQLTLNSLRLTGLETVALRYFNVFGPRQDPASQYAAVIPKFIVNLLAGRSPDVYGDGHQSRDFSFVENVVDANLLACTAPSAVCARAYNIACGQRTTLLDLLEMLGRILDMEPSVRMCSPRPGDVRHSQADIRRAQQALGYAPRASLFEGLERTVAWFRDRT